MKNWKLWLLLSLTLGLMPFSPEPHILGKVRWIMGGAKGMGSADWFDAFWHGFPFIGLVFSLISLSISKKQRQKRN